MARHGPREIVASAARTVTGQSAAQGFLDESDRYADKLNLLVAVTAVSGTSPNMTLTVEWSNDGTVWHSADPVDTFTVISAASNKVKTFDARGPIYRLVWTLTGTSPSFTFKADQFTR